MLVTTFTPGPGNISSAGMGMNYGYTKTLRFLAGISSGYFCVMALSAFLSGAIINGFPTVEPLLRILGTGYILYLAWGTAKAGWNMSSDSVSHLKFKHGFLIQVINPKAAVFGITIYTGFLSGIYNQPLLQLISVLYLTFVTFLSVSLWTFGGTRIKRYLHLPKVRIAANIVLTSLLLYCAISISGLSFNSGP
ncbi:MAG: LysE family translocator [Spirochaetales bacterium]|uniref:LysE family translocator n=1 Tax=Candidatus Thalassospirochaeta sargassi TaxID=3119039 RepID=A0AAJ1MLM0_9SPIO|nr:LysE family translocator [Spirochaetales bacterium]